MIFNFISSLQGKVKVKRKSLKYTSKNYLFIILSIQANFQEENQVLFDPDREIVCPYYLIHRKDTKQCPKSVKRCESCKRVFSAADHILVKTTGEREFVDKKGKVVRQNGNVYLHYLTSCLKEHKPSFTFDQIVVCLLYTSPSPRDRG